MGDNYKHCIVHVIVDVLKYGKNVKETHRKANNVEARGTTTGMFISHSTFSHIWNSYKK